MTLQNPVVRFEQYRDKYRHIRLSREDGILEMTMHSAGGPWKMSGLAHAELADAFYNIGADHENRILIITGTGESFCDNWERGSFDKSTPEGHAKIHYEGRRILQNLLDVEAIVISAVNGPSIVHSFPMVADILLASDTAVFADNHFAKGGVPPGDGANAIWQHLLGPMRGKFHLLMGKPLTAQEALAYGVAAEVLKPDALMPRAREIARELNRRPATTLRYSRQILNAQFRQLMLAELPGSYAIQKLHQATHANKPLDTHWGK